MPLTTKSVDTEVKDTEVKEAPKKVVKKTSKKLKVVTVAGVKHSFWHPYQQKSIPVGGDGVRMELDSWLQSQVDANYVEILK